MVEIHKLLGIFSMCAAISGTVVAARTAHAAAPLARFSHFGCVPAESAELDYDQTGWDNFTLSGGDLYCPLDDSNAITDTTGSSNTLRKVDVDHLWININNNDSTSTIQAWACVTYSSSFGSICGDGPATHDGVGDRVVSPDLSAWAAHATGYSYARIHFMSGVSHVSTLKGISTSNVAPP